MLDGATAMDPGVNRPATRVSVEAISEVRLVTSTYQAEYGRSSGRADQRRDQERHEPVPRLALRRRAQLQVERQQQDEHPERRSEAISGRTRLGLRAWRPGRQARRRQQAVLLFQPRVQPAHVRQRRRTATACRRLLERQGDFSQSPRPERRALHLHQGSADRRRVLGDQSGGLLSRMAACWDGFRRIGSISRA